MEIGKSVLYTNRAGVDIRIIRISELQFMMEGLDTKFMRISRDEEGSIIMFDPPGGPYTTARFGNQQGTSMEYYDQSWKYLVVERIKSQEDKPGAVLLTCIYTKPIEWIEIE